ncbi:MAG: glycosyltransferase family 39 protein, partial [Candidatus Krumholzibacteria bacterium]|nr:glycosyltransferase family 39 protein [Candidatus Krumholzibacteria bacterium]
MKKTRHAPADRPARAGPRRRDALACAGLLALCVFVRAPFLASFDLVSHDGTYYIAQARELAAGRTGGGAFPPGYPAAVALAMLVVADDVRAAQAVSALAGLVAALALYFMGRDRFGRATAWTCAAVASVTPLFVRLSLTTMSEALYIAMVTGALLAALRARAGLAGVLAGLAAGTRPEALAVAAAMGVVWRRDPAKVRSLGASFVLVYALGVAGASAFAGHLVLLPKRSLLGSEAGAPALALRYLTRLPADAAALFRHLGPVAFALGLWGAWRRRGIVVAALWPAFVNPLFTPRAEDRFILPFVLPALWLAFDAAAAFATPRARRLGLGLLVASGALAFHFNRAALTTPVSEGFAGARDVGLELRERIAPGARVADRKPFVPFYAGARYVE